MSGTDEGESQRRRYFEAVGRLQEALDNVLCLLDSPFVARINGRQKVVDAVMESARKASMEMAVMQGREPEIFGSF